MPYPIRDIIKSFRTVIPEKKDLPFLSPSDEEADCLPLHSLTCIWEQGGFRADAVYGRPEARPIPAGDAQGPFLSVRSGAEYPYLLYLPKDPVPSRPFPMILFLHGIGERGCPPEALSGTGPFRYILAGHALPFIVIAPVVEKDRHWVEDEQGSETDREMRRLEVFIRQMRALYPIDPLRMYLTGLSMGGRGSWKLACRLPGTFAAAAICCGRAAPRDRPGEPFYPLQSMKGLPCWVFHGLRDTVVDPDHSLSCVRRLLELDPPGDHRLTLYPEIGHSCYEHAYLDPRLYAWLEEQKR